ncbi:IS3 family transposase, partial [Salmonella enterica]|uniref:IS3 family transposase n=1 Tax=Salmonella enterica TaxID=28901 RepID=UPI003298D11B
MKYRDFKVNAGRFAVNLMCSALEVSTSGYYAWLSRPESARAQANRQLLDRICEAHQRSRRCYGSPRITQELRAAGHCVGENRVARLMRAAQIRAKSARKWRATTKSSHR